MSNTVYSNTVLESKMTELLNSRLEVRALMDVDDSLGEGAGLSKVINRYTYTGKVEQLASGASNSVCGSVSFTPESYTVKRYQQTFRYNDTEAMKDPYLVDAALAGAADVMASQIKSEYFAELAKIKQRYHYTGSAMSYTDVVDALSMLGREVEDDMFIIMSAEARAAIRKDADFCAARQGEIVYSGQFGTLCGIPVLFSRLVPANCAIITDHSAVKFFVKKEASLEQDRNIETKENTIVYERHGVIALVDDTSSVIIGKKPTLLTVTATAGSDGEAAITCTGMESGGDDLVYAVTDTIPVVGEDLNSWEDWDGSSDVALAEGKTIVVCEVDADGLCIAAGSAVCA
ncbi:MAG: hypothetical protein MJ088_02095 [Clostridia bacterium]|nr:hypothetical protein [Clostridia bacterium]